MRDVRVGMEGIGARGRIVPMNIDRRAGVVTDPVRCPRLDGADEFRSSAHHRSRVGFDTSGAGVVQFPLGHSSDILTSG